MKSPVFTDRELVSESIELGLEAFRCPKSGGVWIPLKSFLEWRESQIAKPADGPTGYVPVLAEDSSRRALICPESGRLLSRFKVGKGLEFHVDRSPVTGGMWLDAGEWETLKAYGLHLELNHVFTASYQQQRRSDEYRRSLEAAFCERIGTTDFAKAEEFKRWLEAHPRRRDIVCYLAEGLDERVG